jgi:peroxiredoxin
MWFKKLILLVLFLFFPALGWAVGDASTESSQDPLIGKAATDVVLPKSDGTSASVINVRQGKKAILVFWATWCPHCYEELGKINDAATAVQKQGIRIILVDVGESKEAVQEYLMRRQIKLSCFIDADNVLQDPYQIAGVPTLFFIDEKGIIRYVTHQFPSDYANYFRA